MAEPCLGADLVDLADQVAGVVIGELGVSWR